MDFYLVRHGEAVPGAQDSRRPLTPDGLRRVEELARLAAAKNVRVSLIFHSGILRAQQTAEILGAELSPSIPVQQMTGLKPEDDPAIAAAELEMASNSIMLVGHLPHMNRLAALLVNGHMDRMVVDFKPAHMACCSRELSRWTIAWVLMPGATTGTC